MKVAILCGGRGTRFREASDVIPKPMAIIGDRPLLWHIMKIYSTFGFNEFVLLLGYKGDYIRDYFINFPLLTNDITVDFTRSDSKRVTIHQKTAEPWKITCVDTGEDSMTGARLFRARKYLEPEGTFCLTYGDGVGDVDISKLVKFHKSHGKIATLTGARPPGRFGELVLKGQNVLKFKEKPDQSASYLNAGFFVFNSSIFDDYLDGREDLILERRPFEKLAEDGELVMYKHDGYWHHMDTPSEFEVLNSTWRKGAPWKIWK